MKAINKMDLADFNGRKVRAQPSKGIAKIQSVSGAVENFRPLGRSSHQEAECSRAPCDYPDRYGQQKSLYTCSHPDGVTQKSVNDYEHFAPGPHLGSQAACRVRGGYRLQYPVPPSLSKNKSLYHRFRLPPVCAPNLENRKPTKRKISQEDKPAFVKRSCPSLVNIATQGQSLLSKQLNTSEMGESSQSNLSGAPILAERLRSSMLNTSTFGESAQFGLLSTLALGMQGQSRLNTPVLKEMPGLLDTATLEESAQSNLLKTLILGTHARSNQSDIPVADQGQRASLLSYPSARKSAQSGLLREPLLRKSAKFGLLNIPSLRKSAESGLLNTPTLGKNAKSGLLNAPASRRTAQSGLLNAPHRPERDSLIGPGKHPCRGEQC